MDRDSRLLKCILGISNLTVSIHGESDTMAGETSGEDAVHHIDSTSDAFDQVFWSSDTHQVVRLIYGKNRGEDIKDAIHIFFRLSDRETTDRNPRGIEIRNIFTRLDSEIIKYYSLDNPKECLIWQSLPYPSRLKFRMLRHTPIGPPMSTLHRLPCVRMRRFATRTLIERHDDISAQCFFDFHH